MWVGGPADTTTAHTHRATHTQPSRGGLVGGSADLDTPFGGAVADRLGSIHGGPRPIPSALGCAGAAAARRARLRRARRSPALLRDGRWSDWQPMPSCTACWPVMLRHAACRDGKVHKLLTSCTVDACSMVQSSVEKLLQMFVVDILVDLSLRCLHCCLHIEDLTPCCLPAMLLSVDERIDINLKYVAPVLESTVQHRIPDPPPVGTMRGQAFSRKKPTARTRGVVHL